jgi:MSHA biogenesis protein MshM
MYLEHFGLREAPFSLTPDTGYFFRHGAHQAALNTLLIALRSGEGFLKLTGEVGTGKTLLCRLLLKQLGADFVTAYLPNPTLTPAGLRRALASELGVKCAPTASAHALLAVISEALISHAAAGRRVVLLIDEAQALSDESLESLRLLSNLETEKRKLLQLVLFGQPELDQRLAGRHLRQLAQRISFSARLEPFDRTATRAYVAHRLAQSGARDELFTARAVGRLHQASGGVPRRIHILAHKALIAAYGAGRSRVGVRELHAAIRDQGGRRLPRALGWLSAGAALATALSLWAAHS